MNILPVTKACRQKHTQGALQFLSQQNNIETANHQSCLFISDLLLYACGVGTCGPAIRRGRGVYALPAKHVPTTQHTRFRQRSSSISRNKGNASFQGQESLTFLNQMFKAVRASKQCTATCYLHYRPCSAPQDYQTHWE